MRKEGAQVSSFGKKGRGAVPTVMPHFASPEERVLPNGTPLFVINSGFHDALRIDVVVGAGGWEQDKLLQALFTNRMLREGTYRLSSSILAEKLDYYGAWLELSVSVHHSFITLYTLSRFAGETCSLLCEMLAEPLFPEERFEVIRTNNLQQYRVSRQRGDVTARRLLYASVYGAEHPCGRFAEERDFLAITCDDLRDFYRKHYHSSNCFLCLSGKVTDEVLRIVADCFGKAWGSQTPLSMFPPKTFPEPLTVRELHRREKKPALLEETRPHLAQSSLRIGGLMMKANSADYYGMRVLCTLLGGYFGSRLMKRVREEKGYTYGISADLITNTGRVLFIISSETAAGKEREVVDDVRNEMERLASELVPETELAMVRNYMLGELCRNYEGAFALADACIYLQTLHLPKNHIEKTVNAVAGIGAEELRELARKWLTFENMQTVVIKP